jgi:hypothetical protein
VFPCLKGEGDGAAHLLEGFGGDPGFQCPLEFLPGVGVAGEEGLADMEGLAVVVGIEKLSGHLLAAGAADLNCQRVVRAPMLVIFSSDSRMLDLFADIDEQTDFYNFSSIHSNLCFRHNHSCR